MSNCTSRNLQELVESVLVDRCNLYRRYHLESITISLDNQPTSSHSSMQQTQLASSGDRIRYLQVSISSHFILRRSLKIPNVKVCKEHQAIQSNHSVLLATPLNQLTDSKAVTKLAKAIPKISQADYKPVVIDNYLCLYIFISRTRTFTYVCSFPWTSMDKVH